MYPKVNKPATATKPKNKQLTVSVIGKQMKISCPPGQEDKLKDALAELEARVANTRYQPGVHGAEDVLLMIALNLCNEILEIKNNAE